MLAYELEQVVIQIIQKAESLEWPFSKDPVVLSMSTADLK
jgi:hypothetical protein